MDVFESLVQDEVARARGKFPDQEETLTLAEWHAVLDEEVGEVAKAINDAPRGDRWDEAQHLLANLMEECVQVAAMAWRTYTAAERRVRGVGR